MTVKTLIFDFDGLILDTEYPIYQAIQNVYQRYGVELPLSEYTYCIGSYEDEDTFLRNLEEKINHTLDRALLKQEIQLSVKQDVNREQALPGVASVLEQAKNLGLQCVIASSSGYEWVNTHLERLRLRHYFSSLSTADEVEYVKPNPELFLLALNKSKSLPQEAIVFEDSVNGIQAALKAGIYRVAVPNRITCDLDFSNANVVLNRIDEIPLPDLLKKVK